MSVYREPTFEEAWGLMVVAAAFLKTTNKATLEADDPDAARKSEAVLDYIRDANAAHSVAKAAALGI